MSTSSYTLTAEELARKRERDRRSQARMRDRTKGTILELEQRVMQLTTALAEQANSFETLLCDSEQQIDALRAENQGLRQELEESKYARSETNLEDLKLPGSSSKFDNMPMLRPLFQGSAATVNSTIGPFLHCGKNIVAPLPIYAVVPMSCPPTCLSDRIIQNYIEARRRSDVDSPQAELSEEVDWLPDINALLGRSDGMPKTENRSISGVVTDILLSYREINTLPRKCAVLYLMYKLLNWMIHRTPSTYYQLPFWLRPIPLQITTPHPSWIDRIPWPNARAYLITHTEITFDDFAMMYSSSFEISWPYSPSHVIESHLSLDYGWGNSLNPVYEQHLRQLKNWTVGEKFKRRFPDLGDAIEKDRSVGVWP